MSRTIYPISEAEWLFSIVSSYRLDDQLLRVNVGPLNGGLVSLTYDPFDRRATQAVHEIMAAYAHERSANGSWCPDCHAMRSRGESCHGAL